MVSDNVFNLSCLSGSVGNAHTFTHSDTWACTHHTLTYTLIHIHTHTQAYTHRHTHTHTQACTHTHTQRILLLNRKPIQPTSCVCHRRYNYTIISMSTWIVRVTHGLESERVTYCIHVWPTTLWHRTYGLAVRSCSHSIFIPGLVQPQVPVSILR